MRFRTERLYARQLRDEDIGGFYELNSNPSVMRYLGNHSMSRDECTHMLHGIVDAYANPLSPYIVLAVVNSATEEFVGTCSIIRNQSGQHEINYRLIELFWGNGYGEEITEGLLTYCANMLNIQEVFAYVHEDNAPTLAILERMGMTRLFNFYNYETESNEWLFRHGTCVQEEAPIAS